MADRAHGGNAAGNGDFYEGFMNSVYLSAGTYRLTCWARFSLKDSYQTPIGIRLAAGGTTVDNVVVSHTNWQLLDGNLTVSTGEYFPLFVEFHLRTNGLLYGGNPYFLDEVVIRKSCNPELTHGIWGAEEPPTDYTPPEISSLEWVPTCPYPFVPSSMPRQGEPVLVKANVSDEGGGSGIARVELSYRADAGAWWNESMTLNATTQLWTATIPAQIGNTTIEFLLKAYDNAGNTATSTTYTFNVKALIAGDINGDGIVNIMDATLVGLNWLKQNP
jgi:hypothetical protein